MDVKPGYKQTEVGVIPEDWGVAVLASLGKHGRPAIKAGPFGSSLTKDTYVAEGYKVYGQEQVIRGDHLYGDYYISKKRFNELRSCSVEAGDILLSLVGTAGRVLVIPPGAPEGIINPRLIRFSFDRKVISPIFFHFLFETAAYQALLARSAQGGTMGVLNAGLLRPIAIPLPGLAEQEAIAGALSDADALIESLEQLLAKKRQLKQGVMQELLTGKKRLPGFSGEWEVKPFDGVMTRLNAKAHQIQKSDYQTAGRYPVVDQGKEYVIGFSDRHDKRLRCPEGGVIVFGDHTCIVKFVDFDFLVGADGTQVLQAKGGQCTRFHALQLQHRGVESTGYNRHFKFLNEREFLAPPLPEQTAIAVVLSDTDAEIAALEAKLAKARSIKQGMMQELLTGRIRLVVDGRRATG